MVYFNMSECVIKTQQLKKQFIYLMFLFQLLFSEEILANATPEDWVSGSPFSHYTADETDAYTNANLNITYLTEEGWKWDKTQVGRFGGGYVGPASGLLVHVSSRILKDDHCACHFPLNSSRTDGKLPPPGVPWIALVKRGRCNFEVKVDNAFRSNAAGVLVYNDRDSPNLDLMQLSSDPRRNISAVFIYKWKGEELAKLVENNSKVYVHITLAGYSTSKTASINRTSVLFVSITFIVLMIVSLTWLVFYYVQRFRLIRQKDNISRKLGNAAKRALSKIPTKHLKSDDKEIQGDYECCAVCIEPYKLNEMLRILPCGHEFHKNCIDPWLLEHRTCPMCKMDILTYYGFVFTGSQESILQIDSLDDAVQEGLGNSRSSSRRVAGLSPLPEIRAVIINEQRQCLFDSSADEESSRASTPNEMTPSLPHRVTPVRQELCVSCIAAKAAAAIVGSSTNQQSQKPCTSKITNTNVQQVLTVNNDSSSDSNI